VPTLAEPTSGVARSVVTTSSSASDGRSFVRVPRFDRAGGDARAAGLLVLVALLAGCGGDGGPPGGAPSGADVTPRVEYAAALEDGVNGAREAEGVDALTHDDCAATLAAARADELVGANRLTHRPLDDVLETCDVSLAAENLSRASEAPEDVVTAWMGSAGHAANIRDARFTRGAVACEEDGEEAGSPRMVCVQIFLAE
jgi:hypothetical protein